MKKRKYYVPISCQLNPDTYTRLKMAAKLQKVSMSSIIRKGVLHELTEIDKANNAMREEIINEPKEYYKGWDKREHQGKPNKCSYRSGEGYHRVKGVDKAH